MFAAAVSGAEVFPMLRLVLVWLGRRHSVVTPGRNVLVVTTVDDADADVLRSHVGPDDTVKVVVPVVWQGVLDWLASDERAIGEATEVAQRTAEQLPGETAEATAGAPDVALAIR